MSRVLLLAFVAALLLFPTAAGAGASGVVVSQIYGGGGNAGATFRNDFVELFNGGSGTADLSGWTVQYATAAGTTWQTTALSGTIAPGRYYLIQLASNADVGLGGLARRGSRRLRQRERLRGYGLGGGTFQHIRRAARERRLHRHGRQRDRLHGGGAHASELRLPGALVHRHAFPRAERLRERRSRRGFRPLRVARPPLAELRHVHVRR